VQACAMIAAVLIKLCRPLLAMQRLVKPLRRPPGTGWWLLNKHGELCWHAWSLQMSPSASTSTECHGLCHQLCRPAASTTYCFGAISVGTTTYMASSQS
jgi:hypothetical protein